MSSKRKPVKLWKIVAIPVAMFGFAFSLVPLYTVFCDLTGFNGKSSTLIEAENYSEKGQDLDFSRKVSVTFVTNVAPGLPMVFYPKGDAIEIIPGKIYQATFIAENRSDKTIIGQAIPSVSPPQAAVHFRKMECFCFQEQQFAPRDKVEMPVRFTVDPAVDTEVKDVSLAYTFYLKKNAQKTSDKTVIRTHNEDFSKIKTMP